MKLCVVVVLALLAVINAAPQGDKDKTDDKEPVAVAESSPKPEPHGPKEGCSEFMCKMHCEHDFQRDAKGCRVCKCNDHPVKATGECGKIQCQMHCEHGFMKDQKTGCDVCKCAEAKKGHGGHAWGYTGNIGPVHWGEMYKTCKDGVRQSPINIVTAETKFDDQLEDFALFNNLNINDYPGLTMAIKNDGHKINIGVDGTFLVSGGTLGAPFKVAGVHFHWGKENTVGSEHQINGKAFPLEMHIVTFDNERFETVGEALHGEDSLAVLGVLFEIQDDNNTILETLVDYFDEIEHPNGTNKVKIPTIPINKLLPTITGKFFRYLGSLTTPGCFENVIWTVFSEPVGISAYQMNKFRELKRDEEGELQPLVNNYRPTQDLKSRQVYSSYMAAPVQTKNKPDPGYNTLQNKNRSNILSCSSPLVFIVLILMSYTM